MTVAPPVAPLAAAAAAAAGGSSTGTTAAATNTAVARPLVPALRCLSAAWNSYLAALDLHTASFQEGAARLQRAELTLIKAHTMCLHFKVVSAAAASASNGVGTAVGCSVSARPPLHAATHCCNELWPERLGKGKQARTKLQLKRKSSSSSIAAPTVQAKPAAAAAAAATTVVTAASAAAPATAPAAVAPVAAAPTTAVAAAVPVTAAAPPAGIAAVAPSSVVNTAGSDAPELPVAKRQRVVDVQQQQQQQQQQPQLQPQQLGAASGSAASGISGNASAMAVCSDV